MILLYFSYLECSDEKPLVNLAAETAKPMSKSEYDMFSDSLVSWNKEVCRRETGTIAGKGNPHSQLTYYSHEFLCIFSFFPPHICNYLPSGVFAITDLREAAVVAKYEGHLVSPDGTIQIRCTRTDILFTYRAELNREWTKLPLSREHCASVMVTVTCYFYTVFLFFIVFLCVAHCCACALLAFYTSFSTIFRENQAI